MRRSTFKKIYESLEQHLKDLSELLLEQPSTNPFIQNTTYSLPHPTIQDELVEPSIIEILQVNSGRDALIHAGQNYENLVADKLNYTNEELSTRFTHRHPGIIHVSHLPERIVRKVNDINAIKDSLKQMITTLKTNDERFNFVHDAVPYLMTLHLYRHIKLIDLSGKHVLKASFLWTKRAKKKPLSKEEALNLVTSRMKIAAETLSTRVSSPEAGLYDKVASQSSHTYIQRQYSRPQPTAQLTIYKSRKPITYCCNMPIILIGTSCQPIKFSGLTDYQEKSVRPFNYKNEILISKSLNLFAQTNPV